MTGRCPRAASTPCPSWALGFAARTGPGCRQQHPAHPTLPPRALHQGQERSGSSETKSSVTGHAPAAGPRAWLLCAQKPGSVLSFPSTLFSKVCFSESPRGTFIGLQHPPAAALLTVLFCYMCFLGPAGFYRVSYPLRHVPVSLAVSCSTRSS